MIAEAPIDGWGQLGVAGLAVAGAFWLIWKVIQNMGDKHAEEREKWMQSNENTAGRVEKSADKVEKAIDRLTDAINQDRNR